tara:strand:- start:820 stop:1026 length:207 start_codon:yes stop_codon:yes gene_type:complete
MIMTEILERRKRIDAIAEDDPDLWQQQITTLYADVLTAIGAGDVNPSLLARSALPDEYEMEDMDDDDG